MPYDEVEEKYKFHVIEEDGQLSGTLFTPHSSDRYWTGKLKSNLAEILYRVQDEAGVSYFLVHRFYNNEKFDCCKILNSSKATKWLTNEGYLLPDDLKKTVEGPQDGLPPLPDAQKEVWDLLEGQALTSKELAQKVLGGPVL